MNGRINRIVSAVLLLAMMFSIAACGKSTDKNTKKITADTPWYEAEIIDFKTELNPKKQAQKKKATNKKKDKNSPANLEKQDYDEYELDDVEGGQ